MVSGNVSLSFDRLVEIIMEYAGCDVGSVTADNIRCYVDELSKRICHSCGSDDISFSSGVTTGKFRFCNDCNLMLED